MKPTEQTYTFICDWLNYMTQITDNKFVVVASGTTYEKAVENAAKAILDFFPNVAEYASPKTLWDHERGVIRLAEFYGNQSGNLVDRDTYDHIHA
ncbi:hypothetical protein [Streptomyces lasiicapitis]|uniref:Uncharacterized protein n=1 Tax=Streptomyces lasiicapitis TaxID=1923961 RepID=A0ABQ2MWK8_9ACTN|nr:hypothetical protein [Streptomyces lasiicapitis]GGO58782.1 hypothetical protein GCM10012286_78860 [Streptomyces lasiicapitis]